MAERIRDKENRLGDLGRHRERGLLPILGFDVDMTDEPRSIWPQQRPDLEWLREFIDTKLTKPQRRIIEGLYWEQITMTDLGRELGIGPGATYWHLRKAEEKIREEVERRGELEA